MTYYLKSGCLILFSLFAVCSAPQKPAGHSGQITHIVLCWLNEPGNAEHKKQIIETSRALGNIPGVLSVCAGVPLSSDRPVVDDSFDVGITFVLEDTIALKTYLQRPEHQEAQKKVLQPLVKKVLVYDIMESGCAKTLR